MIIIGYQGIGKSSLAKNNSKIIDLESGNFWYHGFRPYHWYVYYCQIAEDLSKQGYTVFVSSHKEVRQFLIKNCSEPVGAIVPDIKLKHDWIEKLRIRYEKSRLDKDKKAWLNAVDRYEDNVNEIIEDIGQANTQIIYTMNYLLDKKVSDMLYFGVHN